MFLQIINVKFTPKKKTIRFIRYSFTPYAKLKRSEDPIKHLHACHSYVKPNSKKKIQHYTNYIIPLHKNCHHLYNIVRAVNRVP